MPRKKPEKLAYVRGAARLQAPACGPKLSALCDEMRRRIEERALKGVNPPRWKR